MPSAARDTLTITGPADSPVLSKPQMVFPDRVLAHADLIAAVRQQYEDLLAAHPGDQDYQDGFVGPARVALKAIGSLTITGHPLHLPLAEIVRPRGLAARNAQAAQAFALYAQAAAKDAIAAAHVTPDDIGAVVVETSTVMGMPPPGSGLLHAAGLRPDTEIIPIHYMGCNGGAHGISRARDWVLAHGRPALIVTADYCSPWFYREPDLRGSKLRGAIVSAALFSDATAAAVMLPARTGAPGFAITGTSSLCLPGTDEALGYAVRDDGPHFQLTEMAMKLVPDVMPALAGLLARQGWDPADLSVCSFHTGGDRIIGQVQAGLGLTDHQVAPTRQSLLRGNLISSAVLDALALIAGTPALRPPDGGRGLGAGFGPGFSCVMFTWTYHDPARP
jgi:predicted naringenin-chalcone synthase